MEKGAVESEKLGIKMVRRSLTTNKKINLGTIIKESDIGIKRPADGIAPKHFKEIIGMKVKENIEKDEPIKWENLKKLSFIVTGGSGFVGESLIEKLSAQSKVIYCLKNHKNYKFPKNVKKVKVDLKIIKI